MFDYIDPRDDDQYEERRERPRAECEHHERGERCGHSDCEWCGLQVAVQLRADAKISTAGKIALTAEVGRVQRTRGNLAPDFAVTHGDLARHSPLWSARDMSLASDWAEGVLDAQSGETPTLEGLFVPGPSRNAYRAGRAAYAEWAAAATREPGDDRDWLSKARSRRATSRTATERTIAAVHHARYSVTAELPPVILPSEFVPCSAAEKNTRLSPEYAAVPTGTHGFSPTGATSGAIHRRQAVEIPGFDSRAQHR
jgi:hypothetical protein